MSGGTELTPVAIKAGRALSDRLFKGMVSALFADTRRKSVIFCSMYRKDFIWIIRTSPPLFSVIHLWELLALLNNKRERCMVMKM